MEIEVLVVKCLTDYLPHVMITLILNYGKFSGISNGMIDDTHQIGRILLLPNQKIITSSFKKSKIQLWNPYNQKCEKTFDTTDIGKIQDMKLLMDGRILVILYGLIKIFDPINWTFDVDVERQCDLDIKLVTPMSLDMIYILLTDHSEKLVFQRWNIKTNSCKSTRIKSGGIDNQFFFYSMEKMIECQDDGTMLLYNLQPMGDQCIILIGDNYRVGTLLKLPNNHLVTGYRDKTIKIWDMNTNTCINTLSGHRSNISALRVLPDNRLVSGSYDQTIKLWNLKNGNCEMTLENESLVCEIVTSKHGWIASYHNNNTIKFWI